MLVGEKIELTFTSSHLATNMWRNTISWYCLVEGYQAEKRMRQNAEEATRWAVE